MGGCRLSPLLHLHSASLPEGRKGWGFGGPGPSSVGDCAAAGTRSLHCGALSSWSGQGWRGGSTAPEAGAARGAAARRSGRRGRGGLKGRPSRAGAGPAPAEPTPLRGLRAASAGVPSRSPKVTGLSAARNAVEALSVLFQLWRPELCRGRDGEAGVTRRVGDDP